VRYDVSTVQGFHGDAVDALSVLCACPGLEQHGAVQKVLVHLMVYDRDDVRGALKQIARDAHQEVICKHLND